MENQVLEIGQMEYLQKVGIDISKASMCLCISGSKKRIVLPSDSLCFLEKIEEGKWEIYKVFTLQDCMKLLPATLENYVLRFEMECIAYVWWDPELSEDDLCAFSTSDNMLRGVYEILEHITSFGYL